MLAQAGIFNPLFIAWPIPFLLLLCLPWFFFLRRRGQRIRQIEIKTQQALNEQLQDLSAESQNRTRDAAG